MTSKPQDLERVPDIGDLEAQVAELKRANTRLERSAEELRGALSAFQLAADGATAGLYIFQDGRFSYVNPALAEIFRLDRQKILEELLPEDLAHPDDRLKVREFLRRQLEGETRSSQFVYRGVRADGSVVQCEEFSRAVDLNGRRTIVATVLDVSGREAAQQSLIESEALFRGLAEKSPNMILILQDDQIAYANPASESILGYRRPELLSPEFDYRRVAAGEWADRWQERLAQQLAGGEVEPFEFQVLRKDGQRADVLQSSRLINHRGKVGILLVVSDITSHKRAIEDAQLQLKRETLLKEAIGVFASTLDVDTVLSLLAEKLCQAVDATSAYLCAFNRESESVEVLAEYYAPSASEAERRTDLGVRYSLPTVFPGTLAAIEQGRSLVRLVSDPSLDAAERAHMEQFGAKATLVTPVNVAGQVIAYAAIWESRSERNFTHDEIELCQAIAQQAAVAIESGRLYERAQREIADRQRAQEALRESEERYRAVAESAFTGIILLNTDYQLSFVNPAFAELVGYHPEALLGIGLAELMDSEQFAKLREHDRAHAGGQRSQYDLILRRRDGSTCQVLISAAPMHNARGQQIGSVMVVTDISEQKATEDALSVAMVRMEEGLQRTRDLIEAEQALRDTTATVSGTLNLDEVLDRILENVGRVVGHDTADIMLLIDTEDGKRELRPVRGRGYAERGLTEWLMQMRVPWQEMENFRKMERTGRPIAVPDTRTFPGWVELPETRWIGSYAGAPLRRKGKTFGFLNLSSELPGTYQQSHAERLQSFADQAAVAIENARLYAQAQAEIEQRARTQAALRISEQRSRSIFDGVQDAILVASASGQILEVNPAACELFQAGPEGLLKRNVWDLVSADPATVLAEGGQAEGTGRVPVETVGHRPDGSSFEAEIAARLHGLGNEALVIVVVRDISERKAAEAAERNFAKMKQEFVLSASHSLRTPLHTLKGYLELLASGKVREPGREAEFLGNAIGNAERIEQIVHELLDITQMESETGRLRMESVALSGLLGSTLEPVAEAARQRGIRLVLEQSHPHLRVAADGRRLAKAIREIVGNAIKFSPDGGVVTVQAMEEDGRVKIRVVDQGPGLPEAELASLLSNSGDGGSSEVPSPGLGLYLAHAVIDAHAGEIRVQSEPGRGTTFEILIPSGT